MATNFQDITAYDVPQVAAAQALRDPLSLASPSYWRRLLLDREALSPIERKDLADIIHEGTGIGADRFSRSILEAATNPFVYLALVTSPMGGEALKAGKSLFAVAKESGWYQRHMGLFGPLFKSVLDNTQGSPVPQLAMQKASTAKRIHEESQVLVRPARQAMVDHLNAMLENIGHKPSLKSLSKEEQVMLKGTDPTAWDLLEQFKRTQAVYLMKADMGNVENYRRGAGKKLILERRSTSGGDDWLSEAVDELDTYAAGGVGSQRLYFHSQLKAEKDRLKAAYQQHIKDAKANGTPIQNRADFMEENRLIRGRVEDRYPYQVDQQVQWDNPLIKNVDKYEEYLAKFGKPFEDLMVSEARAKQYVYVKHFGDESLFTTDPDWLAGKTMKTWRPDRDKVAMFVQSVARYEPWLQLADFERHGLEGLDLIREIVGPDRAEKLMGALSHKGAADLEKAIDQVSGLVLPMEWGDTRWYSRNHFRLQKVGTYEHGDYARSPNLDALKTPAVAPPTEEAAQGIGIAGAVGRAAYPRTHADLRINSDQLDDIFETFGASPTGYSFRDKQVLDATLKYHKQGSGNASYGLVVDGQAGTDRYLRTMGSSAAETTTAVNQSVVAADADTWDHVNPEVNRHGVTTNPDGELEFTHGALQVPIAFGHGLDINRRLADLSPEQLRRTSIGMGLDREYLRVGGPTPEAAAVKRKYLMEFVRPAMGDRASEDFTAAYRSMQQQKLLASWFVNSPLGTMVSKLGKPGQRMYDGLKAVAEYPDMLRAYNADKSVASYLYVTHLGANTSSIILNLMQPLIVASAIGKLPDVLGAYSDALHDMWGYASRRGQRGVRFPSVDEKLEDMRASFGFMGRDSQGINVLDIGPDFNQVLDSRLVGRKGLWNRINQVFMSGFEKSEWFNRDVTAHMVKRAYAREGRNWKSDPQFLDDAHQAVLRFQYAQHDLNTPGMFLKGPFRSQLLRMFMTFPLRTFTLMTSTAGDIGSGVGKGLDKGAGMWNFWLRTMGTSAFIHEATRNLLHVNVDRGLALQSSTEFFGGDKMLDHEEFPIALTHPPVVDIIYGLAKGIKSADEVAVADAVARLIPGGVALSRAWGVSSQLPKVGALWGMPGILQKTYAGWDQMQPGGLVPVYSSNGTLIDYRHWSDLVARSFGLDMGAWGEQGRLDHYLVKQRDEILKYRHEYLRRLRMNDVAGAQNLKKEFGKRFKDPNGNPLPLTVARSQAERYLRSQITSRSERILDQLPGQVRGAYGQVLKQAGGSPSLPQDVSLSGTAKSRDPWRPAASAIDDQVRELLARQQRVGPAATPAQNLQGL